MTKYVKTKGRCCFQMMMLEVKYLNFNLFNLFILQRCYKLTSRGYVARNDAISMRIEKEGSDGCSAIQCVQTVRQLIGMTNKIRETGQSASSLEGNCPIRHVETCPDFFFHCKSTHNKIHCQNSSS
jgi:hypothetical protein